MPRFTWPGGDSGTAGALEHTARAAWAIGFASLWVMNHFF